MVLASLRLGTQSTTTGLMAKHCYTASLLSMVSSHFAVPEFFSHVPADDIIGEQVENAEVQKPKYGNRLHAGCNGSHIAWRQSPFGYRKGTVVSQ